MEQEGISVPEEMFLILYLKIIVYSYEILLDLLYLQLYLILTNYLNDTLEDENFQIVILFLL